MHKRFIIVGAQRTGSSALAEAMLAHPDVACGWEWTQRVGLWRKIPMTERALAGDFSVLPDKHRRHMSVFKDRAIIGFRRLFRSSDLWLGHPRFSPALIVDELERHLDWLARNPDIRVIHIVRNDHLAWVKSKALSAASGLYKGKPYPEGLKIQIPVKSAIRRVASKVWVDERLATLSKTNRYLRSSYEEFLGDNRGHTQRALSFLGCDPELLPPLKLSATVQSGRQATVTNLDELREQLTAHAFQVN